MTRMTTQDIQEACKKQGLYKTAELNTVLYLNYRDYDEIEDLDEYVNVRTLYLEGNNFTKIKNLDKLQSLKCLYLPNNAISEIENICSLSMLDTLILSNNLIEQISDKCLPSSLINLNLSYNCIQSVQSILPLEKQSNLEVLDLSNNKIRSEDAEVLIEFLKQFSCLKILSLAGNPVVRGIRSYRKNLIASLPSLKALDHTPVFDSDRRIAEAWMAEGIQGEKEEREILGNEEKQRRKEQMEAFAAWVYDQEDLDESPRSTRAI
eukprot:gb/GECH01011522.1/.p1 GENE.gb/GECH01011522.1/~~gb/GECH01011522.1/.p1  ORF type:complete len:264 (+),score=60.93 gb/GECH01011522.1/:1-792(+)